MRDRIFYFYAIMGSRGYQHFYTNLHPAICSIIGHKIEDFVRVKVTIKDEIDLDADSSIYNGVYCGFYDFKKDELSGTYIFNSLLLTQVCFPYELKKYHRESGLFVTLSVEEVAE